MKDATTVLDEADGGPTKADLAAATQHYVDNAGQMETAADSSFSETVLDALAEQFTNPVQSVDTASGTYYGVIDLEVGDEWYGFQAHDERSQGRRVVGIQEAKGVASPQPPPFDEDDPNTPGPPPGDGETHTPPPAIDPTRPANLPHATAGDPSGSFGDQPDADYSTLADGLDEYYTIRYGNGRAKPPVEIPVFGPKARGRGPPEFVQR